MKTDAARELDELLSEPVATAKARAATIFDEIARGTETPIVLFGAGGLGKRIAEALVRIGRPAIAFADNNTSRAGTTHAGLPIFKTEDAIAKWGKSAVFVVAVWRSPATERMSDRERQLRDLGAECVTSFATLGWKHPKEILPYYALDLPHQVLEAKAEVLRAFELLADEPSRVEYVAHVRWRLHLDFAGLCEPRREPEYFAPDLFTLADDERFVDCGAYDGDTVRSFLSLLPRFRGQVSAFEPDRGSFTRLEAWRSSLPEELRGRIKLTRAGVGRARSKVTFGDGGDTGSAIGSGGAASVGPITEAEIDIVPLDEEVLEMRPTLVKVDTEGYEPEVLAGAKELITKVGPKLALCVYHRQDHPWSIPLTVQELRDDYRFTLRSYCLDAWDLVLYCVPKRS